MSIQNVRATCTDYKLQLTWLLMEECEGIGVQLAHDSEFTDGLRMFILPKSAGCNLEISMGIWFFRVGTMNKGRIDWMGIPPPITVETTNFIHPLHPPFFSVIHTQPITGAVRFHTNSQIHSYTVLEYSETATFTASSTKTRYFVDPTRGYFDCEGLELDHTYHIRLASPETPRDLPRVSADALSSWIVFSGKRPLAFVKPHGAQDQSQKKRDAVILKEANESKKPIRFGSQSEYTSYLAAKARNTGERS